MYTVGRSCRGNSLILPAERKQIITVSSYTAERKGRAFNKLFFDAAARSYHFIFHFSQFSDSALFVQFCELSSSTLTNENKFFYTDEASGAVEKKGPHTPLSLYLLFKFAQLTQFSSINATTFTNQKKKVTKPKNIRNG